MKKLLFFSLFTAAISSYTAQSRTTVMQEPVQSSAKADDGLLVAYPNPARDNLVLKAKDTSMKIKSVTFYSILGVQVAHYTVNMSAGEINIDKLRPGKYLMRYVLSDNTQKVTQIIKQ